MYVKTNFLLSLQSDTNTITSSNIVPTVSEDEHKCWCVVQVDEPRGD